MIIHNSDIMMMRIKNDIHLEQQEAMQPSGTAGETAVCSRNTERNEITRSE